MGNIGQYHYTEKDVIVRRITVPVLAIKQDALLRQLEALDKHIDRASTQWSRDTFDRKRQQLWREYKLCPVIKERK